MTSLLTTFLEGWADMYHSAVCWLSTTFDQYENSDFWDYLGVPDDKIGHPEDIYPTPWMDMRRYW